MATKTTPGRKGVYVDPESTKQPPGRGGVMVQQPTAAAGGNAPTGHLYGPLVGSLGGPI